MSETTRDAVSALTAAHEQMQALRQKIRALSREVAAMPVSDYTLKDRDGKDVTLSSLFGEKNDLIIIHNMGKGCRYCTLWADGFSGTHMHFENRAGFALVSPDEPAVMREFADSRGWQFRTLSNHGGTFTKDMGFETPEGGATPGFSTFHRDKDGTIRRVGCAEFGPGDDYCPIWHMFDLLEDGPNGWEPQYKY